MVLLMLSFVNKVVEYNIVIHSIAVSEQTRIWILPAGTFFISMLCRKYVCYLAGL